jgi:riboflavin synthase
MFTGLVQDIGTLSKLARSGSDWTVTFVTHLDTSDFEIGESIAVDGACLTVTGVAGRRFTVDVSPETLSRTTLGDRPVGAPVHLERALRVGDRLGGHLMLGHVDGVGTICGRRKEKNAWILDVEAPDEVSPYLIDKGSIAVDGVSLTVNSVQGDRFTLAIIPHTVEKTNLGDYFPGRPVNLEADILGKYVRKFVDPRSVGLSMETLAKAGFST